MFIYNCICVMSDQLTSKAGTITSGEDRFMEWKTKDGNMESKSFADFTTFFEGIFQKDRLLDIIKNFICFNNDGINSYKILAGYHQYFAVRKAVERTKLAVAGDGKIGVFWHTQGSGKSLSMVFYAHLLQQAIDSPTIVVITDRNDLDNQLYGQFCNCKDFLRQEPVQAESRSTIEVFGDYIDVYDMTQAVEDGATRPVYYESRVIKLKLDDKVLAQIDAEYSALAQNADEEVIEKSKHELAFYDALTKPEAVKDFYSNEDLVALTKELTETLRKNKTIDWQKKESARAKMRMIVKKLLKKYKYPPEGQENALKTVISQCELLTDNVADYEDTVSYSINDDYGALKMQNQTQVLKNNIQGK